MVCSCSAFDLCTGSSSHCSQSCCIFATPGFSELIKYHCPVAGEMNTDRLFPF